jgi:CHAT domain-containing protein
MDDLEALVKLSQFRDEPVELLTLSACATALGDPRAALGLAGLGIKAGARSALASLWLVNDRSTAELVTRFYRALAEPGTSKAEALRRAQLALLSQPNFRHPLYWAPFLIVGNWL